MEWISVKERLPEDSTKVRYRMKKNIFSDYVEDIGFYNNGTFKTFDPIAQFPITHWKPLVVFFEPPKEEKK